MRPPANSNAMASHPADATVIITTKNRKDDLRNAVASALMQDAQPRVLVIDDGSTDGTSEMIRGEFPTVQLERSEQSRGLIVQRNYAATLAQTAFIFSIDDDAVFTTPRIVSQTILEFQNPARWSGWHSVRRCQLSRHNHANGP